MTPRFLATPRRRSAAVPFAGAGLLYGTWAARMPGLQAQAGLGEGALGLALLGLAVGLVVSAAAAGGLVARVGAHRVTLGAAVLAGVAVVGPGLAGGFASLAAGFAGIGLSSGMMDVAMNAWAAEVEEADGATLLGACHGLFSVGGMVGAGVGAGAAALGVPLAAHFAAVGLVATIGVVLQGWGLRETGARPEASGPAVALPLGPVAGLAALACAGHIVEGAVGDWGAVFLREVLAASPAVAALGFAAFSACMAGARFGADALTDRVGDVRLVRAGAGLGALGLAAVVLAPTVAVAVAGFGVVGLGMAAVVPALFRAASRAALAPGVGIAAVATAGYLGFLAGPPVLGFVAEAAGLRASFGGLVALAAVIVVGVGAAFRRVRMGTADDGRQTTG